ncbi:unnamed protein product [Lactuca saligna]|uniref:Uncharacterized protein n=1 Tax=Lactuca saligna TaxID=75948 RepID=A0AA35ZPA6_LACSI|nr:unnamed protein product [Lactuca saligna]
MKKWIKTPYECEKMSYVTRDFLSEDVIMGDETHSVSNQHTKEDSQAETKNLSHSDKDIGAANENLDAGSNYEYNIQQGSDTYTDYISETPPHDQVSKKRKTSTAPDPGPFKQKCIERTISEMTNL